MTLLRPARPNTVPVIILAGFLGSGKTTIINYLLKEAVGTNIAVIVNDFGVVNIDSLLINAQTETMMELTNGCICCAVGDGDLEEALTTVLARANRPDVVVIEASGLAEPQDIATLVLTSQVKAVAYGGLVHVIDGLHYEATLKTHPKLIAHVQSADLIVVTKKEQVAAAHFEKVIKHLRQIAKSPIVSVSRGELTPSLLFDVPARPQAQLSLLQQVTGHDHAAHDHLRDQYQTATFRSSDSLSPEKFKHFMRSLPSTMYRVKGFAYFGMNGLEQKFVVQSVGGRWDMYAEPWLEDEAPGTILVFIGTTFDANKLLSDAQNMVGTGKEVLDMHRYTK